MCTVKMGKKLHSKLHAKATVGALALATLYVSAKVAKASSGAVAAAGFCGLLRAFAGFCWLLRAFAGFAGFYGLLPALRDFVGFCGIL